ncbi:membrane protein insertion efficiency factor YidD [Candidatus Marinimicrobia bacterium]|nr:membrane protein insertion efficiency factor YidD [Candidatus Neomarinimicrobiota bacterium]MDC1146046.1 membrane protein insertion efficiency factor YidD [Candidatus Neomarinimicrobiota bacterium]
MRSNYMQNIPSLFFVALIKGYQTFLSPLLGSNCRYQPTCSQYAIDVIKEWGSMKGSMLALKRILRCHPWSKSGYDPVPMKKRNK